MVKGAMVVARGMKSATLYTTVGCTNLVANVVESSCSTSLWYNRLGHMSEKELKIAVAKGSLPGLKSVDLGLCWLCFGKQKRVSFTKVSRELKAKKLELVHTDV